MKTIVYFIPVIILFAVVLSYKPLHHLLHTTAIKKQIFKKEMYQKDHDILSLGLLLSGECLECDLDETFLVGSCVMTRLGHPDYPKTIDEVIQEKNQFHGFEGSQYCFNQVDWDIANWLVKDYRKPKYVLFFWRNTQPTPRYVKKVIYEMKYHNFGI